MIAKRKSLWLLLLLLIAAVGISKSAVGTRNALSNLRKPQPVDRLLREASELSNEELFKFVESALNPHVEEGLLNKTKVLDEISMISKQNDSTLMRLKKSYTTFRISRCTHFNTTEVFGILSNHIHSLNLFEVPTNRYHILSLDPTEEFISADCPDQYKQEKSLYYKYQYETPAPEYTELYTSKKGLHPAIQKCPFDWEWRGRLMNRIDRTRILLNEMITDLNIQERKMLDFPWSLIVPAKLVDLKQSHLFLESLRIQTRFPKQLVLIISPLDVNVKNDCSIVASFFNIWQLFYGKDQELAMLAVSEPSQGAGVIREIGINYANDPYFSTFDIDDMMHPLHLELRQKVFQDDPIADINLPQPITTHMKNCDMTAYFLAAKNFLVKTIHGKTISETRLSLSPKNRYTSDEIWRNRIPVWTNNWYLGNTDAEPKIEKPPYLNFWIHAHNGWHTSKMSVFKAIGYQKFGISEDSLFNARALIAGFDVVTTNRMVTGLYSVRTAKENCPQNETLELRSGADLEEALKAER